MGGYVEKYRPTNFNQVFGQQKIVDSLREIVKRKKQNSEQMPHMLFIGPPGTGKTTLAICLAKELYGKQYRLHFHEFNASDTRGINDIRGKIKPMSRTLAEQIVFFDEADGLTFDSQQALRRIMEKSANATFILSVNNEQKLVEAIRSRCTPFRFRPLDKPQIGQMLRRVLEGEEIKLKKTPEESKAIFQIIEESRGDLRKALNILEKIVTSNKELNVQSVLELKPVDQVSDAIQTALSGDFTKAKNLIEDVYLESGENIERVIDAIYNSIENIEPESIRNRLYFELGDLEHRIQYSYRPLYQLVSFMAFVWIAPHLQK